MIPFLERLDAATNVLVVGCGGGFDVYAGVPLAQPLMARGKHVVFASLSFTNLWLCGGERVGETMWRVDQQATDIPYFPEKWLAEWLSRRDQLVPIYAFAKSGVRPLATAYRSIMDRHDIDTVVLVEGGTDSILFGNEPGLGTVIEDAVSIVAADQAAGERVAAGRDRFRRGPLSRRFAPRLSRERRTADSGRWFSRFSLSQGNVEADAFLDLVDYANQRQPKHQSIVCNSIASALRGEFGNYHATNRTSGNELFINPLMSQYWTFQSATVVRRMAYAGELAGTARVEEVRRIIDVHRETTNLRPFRAIPL